MGIEFDPVAKHIKITSPTTFITALDLYNATMDWVDEQENMAWSLPMRAVGKFGMGGGVYSDSIFMLTNGWKIKPWSGNYQLVISGTLITDDETPRVVPPDSGNVEVVFQVSSQGTLVVSGSGVTEQDKIDIADKVEVLTGSPIKNKTDNLPADPADQSLVEAHVTTKVAELIDDHTVMKEPTTDGYDRDKDSLKKLSEKLDEVLSAPPGGCVFSV